MRPAGGGKLNVVGEADHPTSSDGDVISRSSNPADSELIPTICHNADEGSYHIDGLTRSDDPIVPCQIPTGLDQSMPFVVVITLSVVFPEGSDRVFQSRIRLTPLKYKWVSLLYAGGVTVFNGFGHPMGSTHEIPSCDAQTHGFS